MARATLEELEQDPRPVSADEAARMLNLTLGQLTALNLPVVKEVDGLAVHDSRDVAHWLRMRQADPGAFEERIARYSGGLGEQG